MPYTVTLVGEAAVRAKLGPALYDKAMARALEDAGLMAQRTARAEAPKDTGALARSIMLNAGPREARVFSTLAYAAAMEEGRRPGARMPPPRALLGWLGRHGIDPNAAFVIARSIARRGIKGRFFMKAAAETVAHNAVHIMRGAVDAVEQAWRK